jgi:membrane-associated protease RseP (regulator of RpoE activity)
VSEKVKDLVLYSAIISMGLMYSNMLPIPGLDGNQVILLLVEAVIGRPISKKAENVIAVVGFVVLIGLAVFALASDIIRIIIGA